MTSLIAGVSLGTALGGTVIEASGWQEAVAFGVAVAFAGWLGSFLWRGSLRGAAVPA